jgi:peptide/nickel transport system permease protein
MMRYAARRLLQIIPVLFGISLIVFIAGTADPGVTRRLPCSGAGPPRNWSSVFTISWPRSSLWRQYLHYLDNALHGDFGISFFYQADVWGLTMARLPRTLALMAYSIVLSFVVAIPFSVIATTRRNGIADASIRLGSTVALGIPSFWLGIILALVLGARLKLLPIGGGGTGGIAALSPDCRR